MTEREIVKVIARELAEDAGFEDHTLFEGLAIHVRSTLDAAGFAIVPKEPTVNMYVRGDEEIIKYLNSEKLVKNESTPARDCYLAMLLAASEENDNG
jgi:hypothetical protein